MLGVRASHGFDLGDGSSLTLSGRIGWQHAYGDTTPSTTLAFTDVDLNDTHTVSSAVHSVQWSGGATLPGGLATTLAGGAPLAQAQDFNTAVGDFALSNVTSGDGNSAMR